MINDILNRWAKGESAGTIRRALKLPRNRVSEIVCEARRRGDPRAIHHFHADGKIVGRYWHKPLQVEMEKGRAG